MSNEPIMIIRAQRRSGYFLMSRDTAQNKSLSYDALGMLAYLLSKPDDWEVRPSDLERGGCKKNTVYRVLKELIAARHVRRIDRRTDKGQFIEHIYEVYELPEAPLPKKPQVEKPQVEKQTLHSTEKKRGTKHIQEKEREETPLSEFKTDPALAEVITVYEQNIMAIIPQLHLDAIKDWLYKSEFADPKQEILDAIKIAADKNKRGWDYVNGVLRNRQNESVRNAQGKIIPIRIEPRPIIIVSEDDAPIPLPTPSPRAAMYANQDES